MSTTLTDRWGDSLTDPTADQQLFVLQELTATEPELATTGDAEVSLSWWDGENDWSISTDTHGQTIFGGIIGPNETIEEYDLPEPTSHEHVLALWHLLTLGDLDSIRRLPWRARES